MSNGTQVLREYLLSLGFRVNTTEQRKFDNVLGGVTKQAGLAGAAIVGVTAAATAMVTAFANQMEKLYYASRRTGSTVENLQALQFGAKQIGISGDQIQGAIENMARSLRSSPGLVGLLKSLGVKVEGRDTSDVMKDTVRALRQLPFYVGSKFASLFGIDPDTFLMMSQNLELMEQAGALRKKMNEEAGVDAEKAALAAVEYNRLLNETIARAGVLKDALAIALLPTMTKAAELSQDMLRNITELITQTKSWTDFKSRVRQMLGFDKGSSIAEQSAPSSGFDAEGKERMNQWLSEVGDALRGYGHGGSAYGRAQRAGFGRGFVNPANVIPRATGASPAPQGADKTRALFGALEQQYSLPPGLLNALMMAESQGDTNAVSPTGAKGPFQFIAKTAKEFGVDNPFDLEQSAKGAAAKMSGLLKNYGDLSQALAAWNWGQGNFASVGNNLGASRAETQQFVPRVMQGLQQHIVFHISTPSPQAAADAVGQKLDQVNSQYLQNVQSVAQ